MAVNEWGITWRHEPLTALPDTGDTVMVVAVDLVFERPDQERNDPGVLVEVVRPTATGPLPDHPVLNFCPTTWRAS